MLTLAETALERLRANPLAAAGPALVITAVLAGAWLRLAHLNMSPEEQIDRFFAPWAAVIGAGALGAVMAHLATNRSKPSAGRKTPAPPPGPRAFDWSAIHPFLATKPTVTSDDRRG